MIAGDTILRESVRVFDGQGLRGAKNCIGFSYRKREAGIWGVTGILKKKALKAGLFCPLLGNKKPDNEFWVSDTRRERR